MKVWIDFQDTDDASIEVEVQTCPQIGQKVGARHPEGMEGTDTFVLEFVVDVRHYVVPTHEIRVLVSERR